MTKLYDTVRDLLRSNQLYRNSDRALIWAVLEVQGMVKDGTLNRDGFIESVAFESITRARRKVQENHPELQANETVKKHRGEIQRQKGTHVYREKLDYKYIIGDDNIARRIYQ
jgi:hypothetical protein